MNRGFSSALNSGGAFEQPAPASTRPAVRSNVEYRMARPPLVLARGLAAADAEKGEPGQRVHGVGDEPHAAVTKQGIHSARVTAVGPARIAAVAAAENAVTLADAHARVL